MVSRNSVRLWLEAEEGKEHHQLLHFLKSTNFEGAVTRENAEDVDYFYHRTERYKRRGKPTNSPIMVRRNGRTKTWKRQPDKFRIPVKYGMYDYFYIDNSNAHEWATTEDAALAG